MNKCETEIDTIRLKIYEETKHMSKEEQDKRIRDRVQKLSLQFGFTIVDSSKRTPPKLAANA